MQDDVMIAADTGGSAQEEMEKVMSFKLDVSQTRLEKHTEACRFVLSHTHTHAFVA